MLMIEFSPHLQGNPFMTILFGFLLFAAVPMLIVSIIYFTQPNQEFKDRFAEIERRAQELKDEGWDGYD